MGWFDCAALVAVCVLFVVFLMWWFGDPTDPTDQGGEQE